MLEKEILRECLEKLKNIKPIEKVTVKDENKREFFDGFLQLSLLSETYHFNLIVKKILKRPFPELLKQNLKGAEDSVLIFSEYVNSSIAQDLKEQNIMFIDCQGNIFFHIPNKLFIDVQGNKIANTTHQTNALFQMKGMQLIPLLLNDPSLLNKPIRYLQNLAHISYERTATSLKDLLQMGYIIKTTHNEFVLNNTRKLFEKWVENYSDRLRPKLIAGSYKISPNIDIQKISHILEDNSIEFAFGGEIGAEILTQYYKAGCMDLFIPIEKVTDVVNLLGLVTTEEPSIRLFNLYSNRLIYKDDNDTIPVVLPMIIYAELLYQGNDRAKETANMIFDTYIKDKLS